MPGESSASPRRSSRWPSCGFASGSSRQAATIAATPTGRLMKKIQRQLQSSTITPPSTGPKHRREQHRHPDDAHHAPHPLGPGRLGEHRLPDRQDHPARRAPAAPGRRSAIRSTRRGRRAPTRVTKSEQRRDPDALGAEALARPPAERDHAREGEHVPGQDPLDRRDRRRRTRARASGSRRSRSSGRGRS